MIHGEHLADVLLVVVHTVHLGGDVDAFVMYEAAAANARREC